MGCDDDLDLPLFQVEQLKRKCGEATWQGTRALPDDALSDDFVEDQF